MSSDPNREQSLLQAALALESEAQREAFLNIACADSPGLRERIVQLLAAHADADLFFQEPAASAAGIADEEAARPAAPPPQVEQASGEHIGRYKLMEKIGEGGCGVVYVAEQQEPVRRRVALKVIKLGMDTRSVVARFEAERQALALMDHPNIAKVLDAGAIGDSGSQPSTLNPQLSLGRPYFVMELVRGLKITDYCDQHQLSTAERLDLFIQVCRAVQHAHQKGIIHRDLKPSNILVTVNDGVAVPKVIDFGIAKATEGRLTDKTVYTELHQFLGTPAYMSPEQAELTSVDIDTRSDIYSLGVLLYELLTGKTPFDHQELVKAGLDAMRQIIRTKEPPRPSTRLSTLAAAELSTLARARRSEPPKLIHSVRGDLDWIVMKCLEKDRARRYETANGLAVDLQRHLHNEPVAARPPSKLYRFQKLVRRNKLVCVAAAAVAASLLFGIIASMQEAARARRAEQQQARLRGDADAARRQAETTLATSDFAEANRLIAAGDAADAMAYLSRILAADPTHRAALSQLAMALTYHSWMVPSVSLRHGDAVRSAGFSPDGMRIVTASDDKTAQIWDAKTGLPLTQPLRHEGAVVSAEFSPDGRRVVTASRDHTARVWDAKSGQAITPPLLHDASLESAEFSPDSQYVVTAADDNAARVWDALTGQPLTEPLKHGDHVLYAQFSPDGRKVVTASRDYTARVWDAHTGRPVTGPLKHRLWVQFAQFSPDSRRVVTASLDYTARVWDAQTGEPLTGPLQHQDHVWTARFSPDGKKIVTASADRSARVWDAQTGRPLIEPMKHEKRLRSARFSPDGQLVVTASEDSTARVWDAHTGQLLSELRQGGIVGRAEFSPDGKRIITASADKSACIWDEPIRRALPMSLGDGTRAEFSADGRQAVTTWGSTAQIWDAQTGQPKTGPLRHRNNIYFAEFSPEGQRLATASQDGTARLWDTRTGRQLTPPLRHSNRVYVARFSRDGRRILTASWDKTARVWDAQTGEPLVGPLRHKDYVGDAQFSPDGQRIVTASSDYTAQVWDAQSGQRVGNPMRHGAPVSAHFSPDSRRIVTTSADNTARIWDAQTGLPLTEPLKHSGVVMSAEFSPNGQRIVTACFDFTARIWDAQTGKPLTPPLKHPGWVWFANFSTDGERVVTTVALTPNDWLTPARFSPDGRRIVTASSAARLWDARTGEPLTPFLAYAPEALLPQPGRPELPAEDDEVRLWDVGFVPSKVPDWLLPLAGAISGTRLNPQSTPEQTNLDRAKMIAETRRLLNHQPDDGDGVKWGRWLLAETVHRTISPLSTMTVSNYIANSIQGAAEESLDRAASPDFPPPKAIEARTRESLDEAAHLALGDPELLHRVLEVRDRVLELDLLRSNANYHARAGQWTNAIAGFSKLIEMKPNEHWYHFYLAALLAQSGDLEGYRRHCAHMLALFGATNNPVIADRIGKACLIIPAKGIDLDAAERLADTAVTRGKGHPGFAYFEFAKGLAEYRQGHFAGAIDWMQRVLSTPGLDDNRDAAAWLVLAMAQHEAGKPVEARAALHNATQIIGTKMPALESGDIGDAWNDWIIAHALLKEAQGLIEGDKEHGQQADGGRSLGPERR
jgi:eukaryotic-like serine/threonine-protein kinase